ncbi:4Fe-4S ferredoxin [Spirochaetia bacterium]|nr:4Fe-4S ferredoxin [Spirochaetia bacterium]
MSSTKVYFTSMRTKVGESLLVKLDRLILKAGIKEIDFKQKYAAIKIHFGEPGNLAFLRSNFAKVVADRIKALGGMPFLTDCNTLYVGRRNNALVHLDAAFENGYTPFSTGVQNIIADGLRGTDDVDVPVKGGKYCKVAHIGRAIMDADIVVSLNHFKGHELTGFGGALKNLGMGSGSRAGKMAMHNDGKPEVAKADCIGCKICTRFCNHGAISFGADKKAVIDHKKCVGCGRCIGACSKNAISNNAGSSNDALNCKIVEYAKAVVDGRPNFHINIVNQVSPYCDCHGESDAPVVPDIGIFASFDPVALDKACIDAVNAVPGIESSIWGDREHTHKDGKGSSDHLTDIHPTTDWRGQIAHAEKIGLGTGSYELVTVK